MEANLIATVGEADAIDLVTWIAFFAAVVMFPLAGYWMAVIDIRAYLRALKGVLVRVTHAFQPDEIPAWVRAQTPPSLRVLGLEWPCSTKDVKVAYRKLAEKNHPDLGGDREKFLRLQTHFEIALRFVAEQKNHA